MLGIYIHIPFCLAKCNYCNFNSYVTSEEEKKKYVKALCREIKNFGKTDTVDTIYFGGGTPTCLEPAYLAEILQTLSDKFNLAENCEITTECNPATVDKIGLKFLRSLGVNRLSIGMQSANAEELKVLGRIHSAKDCALCVKNAKEAGFDNISLDLMLGIPKQSLDSWENSLRMATELEPKHISCYALKVEEGTPFSRMKLDLPDEDETCDMYDMCAEILDKKSFNRYEVSNFAVSGFESRHNAKYWLCDDFVGFGAGAYSCFENRRYSNIANTKKYMEVVNSDLSAECSCEELSIEDRMSEFMFLGLRLAEGVSESRFKERFSVDVFDVFGNALSKNIKRGTIVQENGRLRIPDRYIYVGNSIMVDFV